MSDMNLPLTVSAAGMAAYGCLRAINTLLESVAALGSALFPQLEATLYPLICSLVRGSRHQEPIT